MDIVELSYLVGIIHKMVITMVGLNICWVILIMILAKKTRRLESIIGTANKTVVKGKE